MLNNFNSNNIMKLVLLIPSVPGTYKQNKLVILISSTSNNLLALVY